MTEGDVRDPAPGRRSTTGKGHGRGTMSRLAAAGVLLVEACRPVPHTGRAVVDGAGRSVAVPATIRRVVSLAPSVTDSLVALGYADRIAGVCDFCRLPPAARALPRVGGMLNPSLERIRSLAPDLLLASTSGNDPSLAAQSAALGVPLYTIDTPDVETTLRSLESLADLLGDRSRGRRYVAGLRARLEEIGRRVSGRPRPAVLYLVWGHPLIVPGRPAFLTDALRRAGARSISEDAPAAWPTFDLESAVSRRPEVILSTEKNREFLEALRRDPAWASVPAVRTGRVLLVGEAIERPGPAVVDGIEEVARLIHPEAFPLPRPAATSGAPAGPPPK
jgi:iron complex transport system substrate-binding protein